MRFFGRRPRRSPVSEEQTCGRCGGDAGDNWFDRSFCPCEPGLGAMHTRCDNCGYAFGDCSFEEGFTQTALPSPKEGHGGEETGE